MVSDLIDWVKSFENAHVDSRIEIRESGFGKGLFAKEDIEGEIYIIRVPVSALVTVNDAIESEYVQKILGAAIEDVSLSSIELIALFIYAETQNPDTKYSIYLKLLPETYHCPVTWEDDKIKQLPFTISHQVHSIKKRIEELTIDLDLDYDFFLWSFCSAFTRCFAGGFDPESYPNWFVKSESNQYPVSCPLIDLANHSTKSKNLVWSGVCDKKEMYLKTHNPIKKGEELCISYGLDKADDQLYACHGFCNKPGFHKKSRVSIFPQDILSSLEASKKLVMWAYAKNLSKNNIEFYFTLKGPSEDLFFDLAILSGAKADQVKKMRAFDENSENEIKQLVEKQNKNMLKVITTKLKTLYIMEHKKYVGEDIRAVHVEILKKNLLI